MKKYWILRIFLILISVAALFYWFQIRPGEIIKYCDNLAWKEAEPWKRGKIHEQLRTQYYNWKHTQCLHSLGLK